MPLSDGPCHNRTKAKTDVATGDVNRPAPMFGASMLAFHYNHDPDLGVGGHRGRTLLSRERARD